jgi:Cof subfamily protein (haloacid dehalogenase superfamily)
MMKNVLSEISDISITSSFDYNLEICGKSASKAEALRQLCNMLGLTANEVMACGDSHNDIEMLKVVGMPVAVGNANGQVKAIAKYIAPPNNENGVAKAIELFILQ